MRVGVVELLQDQDLSEKKLDVKLCPRDGSDDLYLAEEVVSNLISDLRANGSTYLNEDNFFWLSQTVSRCQMKTSLRANPRGDNNHRWLFWTNVTDSVANSSQGGNMMCDGLFDEIIVTDVMANDAVSILLYDQSTGVSSLDVTTCSLWFVAALSSMPQICSIEVESAVEISNSEAQWITQSGIADSRPWFDVGLTGKGQVVAVSDSGIDTVSCHEWSRFFFDNCLLQFS